MTFKDWCIENDKTWWLDVWDYELNKCNPEDVSSRSNKIYYFWCGNEKHPPKPFYLCNLTSGHSKVTRENFCIGCKSVGSLIEHKYGKDVLDKIWSVKNEKSPYSVSSGSSKNKIWLKCINNKMHPDFDIQPYNVRTTINCPYCAGKRVCKENSIGNRYPQIIPLWSDKNSKTPFEYTYGSNQKVWLKCQNGIHLDYERKIYANVEYGFRCPVCTRIEETKNIKRGKDSPNWNPNLSSEQRLRKSPQYEIWRMSVFERDNYTCQCCGKYGGRLNVHHIYDFANHEDIRLKKWNGITLCTDCHDCKIQGSLHQKYGTQGVTPKVL